MFFGANICFFGHRLLCHSLQGSGQLPTVNSGQTVQECDATKV